MQVNNNQPSFTALKMPKTKGMNSIYQRAIIRAGHSLEELAKDVDIVAKPKLFSSDIFVFSASDSKKSLIGRIIESIGLGDKYSVKVDLKAVLPQGGVRSEEQSIAAVSDALVKAGAEAKAAYVADTLSLKDLRMF